MHAVIMAGGKGTRLSSITLNVPKPMVKILNKPLLEYQVENLRECGISNITMVIGYKGEVIQNYFGDGQKYGVRISYFLESEPLGTAGALVELSKKIREDFIVVFGDLFLDVDFKKMIVFHNRIKADTTLFAHPNSHPYDSDVIQVNEIKRVTGWIYKNQSRDDYANIVNAGIYILSKSIFEGFEINKKIDLEKDVIVPQIKNKRVYAYCSSEYVKDLGTPERYGNVVKDVKSGLPHNRNLKNKQKAIFLDRDGTINKFVGFLRKPEQLELEEGVAEAVKRINNSEYLAIVITNQPVVARGETTLDQLERIHKRLATLLGNEGAYLDALYYCPHHPDKGFEGEIRELKKDCECRKPKIGLINKAVKDFNIDLNLSWFVGDTNVDVMTGKNANIKTVLLTSGDPEKGKRYDVEPDVNKESLLDAVNYIIGRK